MRVLLGSFMVSNDRKIIRTPQNANNVNRAHTHRTMRFRMESVSIALLIGDLESHIKQRESDCNQNSEGDVFHYSASLACCIAFCFSATKSPQRSHSSWIVGGCAMKLTG